MKVDIVFEEQTKKYIDRLRYGIKSTADIALIVHDFDGEVEASHYNDSNYEFRTVKKGQLVHVITEMNKYWSWVRLLPPHDGEGIIPISCMDYLNFSTDYSHSEINNDESYFRNVKWRCYKCMKFCERNDDRYFCLECSSEIVTCEKCYHSNNKLIEKEHYKLYHHQGMFVHMKWHHGKIDWVVQSGCTAERLKNALIKYKDRPCLGYRHHLSKKKSENTSNLSDHYVWITYGEVYERSVRFQGGLKYICEKIYGSNERAFVSCCSQNRVEWIIADLACIMNSYVNAPILITKLLEDDIAEASHIINNSQTSIIICCKKFTPKFKHLASTTCKTIKCIIEMTDENRDEDIITNVDLPKEYDESLVPSYLQVFQFKDVEAIGKKPENEIQEIIPTSDDDLFTIVYTSGSTGIPKGAIITERLFRESITYTFWPYDPLVVMSFAPLAHSSERTTVLSIIANGGRTGIYSGDMNIIFEELQMVKPTLISSTPRLFDRLYGEFHKALAVLKTSLGPSPNFEQEKQKLLKRIPNLIGGRAKAITVGGAPTSDAVLEFMRSSFNCSVNNGYASTECGAITWISSNPNINKIKDVQIKLVDVPELNYLTTDKPYPRGEIWVKSKSVIPGYYRNEAKNKESFHDGWFMTGDIGEMDENNNLKIIDRRKAIFKLSQGEYVSPATLEIMFLKSQYIDQIFIHGDSFKSFLVAVVVPKEGVVKEWAKKELAPQQQGDLSLKHLCTSEKLKQQILDDILQLGFQSKKQNYEIPRAIILEYERFTAENGLLTDTFKPCRHKLTKHYVDRLNQLYEKTEGDLKSSELQRLIESTLDMSFDKKTLTESNFSQLGGDSLAAAKISFLLGKKGIHLSASELLDKGMTIEKLEKLAEKNKGNEGDVKDASEFDIEKEVKTLLDSICNVSEQFLDTITPVEFVSYVLLTGATGFLGAFLLESLINLLPNNNSMIYCLVRAKDEKNAKERIMESLKRSNIILKPKQYERIIPVVGDLSKPLLGLSEQTFSQLCNKIDVIYHNGAHVNFQLKYSELKQSNVGSTVELMKMSCSGSKFKPLHFMSTMSVVSHLGSPVKESDPILTQDCKKNFSKLGGYAQSKIISEILLDKASKERNFKYFTVFRTNMIAPHSKRGTSNMTDWFTRFVCGCIQAGMMPQSDHHVFMVPVEFVSDSVVQLTALNDTLRNHSFEKRSFYLRAKQYSHSIITYNQLYSYISGFGYDIQHVSHAKWYKHMQDLFESEINSTHQQQNPLFAILNVFSDGIPQMVEVTEPVHVYELLSHAHCNLCSPLDETLFSNMVRFLEQTGAIHHPVHVGPKESNKESDWENNEGIRDGDW